MVEAMDKSRAYIFESNPLKIAIDPEIGYLIYTSVGDCFRCISDMGGQLMFDIVHESVIGDGSLLPEINAYQLKLFWALSRTELKKASHGIKDTY